MDTNVVRYGGRRVRLGREDEVKEEVEMEDGVTLGRDGVRLGREG